MRDPGQLGRQADRRARNIGSAGSVKSTTSRMCRVSVTHQGVGSPGPIGPPVMSPPLVSSRVMASRWETYRRPSAAKAWSTTEARSTQCQAAAQHGAAGGRDVLGHDSEGTLPPPPTTTSPEAVTNRNAGETRRDDAGRQEVGGPDRAGAGRRGLDPKQQPGGRPQRTERRPATLVRPAGSGPSAQDPRSIAIEADLTGNERPGHGDLVPVRHDDGVRLAQRRLRDEHHHDLDVGLYDGRLRDDDRDLDDIGLDAARRSRGIRRQRRDRPRCSCRSGW